MSLDIYLFHLINNLPLYWSGWGIIGIFASEVVVWLMLLWYVASFVWGKRGGVREFLAAAVGGAMVYLTNTLISLWWWRPRPFIDEAIRPLIDKPFIDKSFPSDHAAIAFFLAYLITARHHSWWWVYFIAAAVALGRVVVGVHYPLDILVGAGIGVIFGFFTTEIDRFFQTTTLAAGAKNQKRDN